MKLGKGLVNPSCFYKLRLRLPWTLESSSCTVELWVAVSSGPLCDPCETTMQEKWLFHTQSCPAVFLLCSAPQRYGEYKKHHHTCGSPKQHPLPRNLLLNPFLITLWESEFLTLSYLKTNTSPDICSPWSHAINMVWSGDNGSRENSSDPSTGAKDLP